MDIIKAVKSRKCIRGYTFQPVPKGVLSEILSISTRAHSAMNAQPWEFTIVTGEVLEQIKQANLNCLTSGVIPSPDFPLKAYEGVFKERYIENVTRLFALMGISREDKEKRKEWQRNNARFFGSPAVIFISVDKILDDMRCIFDVGAVTQTICLVALSYGLSTCPQLSGISYPSIIRKFTNIPESKRLLIAISIGYPDNSFPANGHISNREALDKITTWCGYD
jgi:nitroreductase